MIAILFRVVAKPGSREDLLDFLQRDSDESAAEDGTVRFDVFPDPKDDHAFFVYEAYIDPGAFEQHMKGSAFQEWTSRIKPQLAEFTLLFRGEPAAMLVKENERV
jgi:quinol monooxygenase YgiN